jgi:catechol 2,3-dioxygenase-like lactoylglutathione lyase family enzyme
MTTVVDNRYDVGGVMLARPFKVRRLGHFGLHLQRLPEGLRFYTELLGYRLSDTLDFRTTSPHPEAFEGVDDPRAFFMRYNGDHHAFVLGSKQAADARRGGKGHDSTGQMSYQVGGLSEVANTVPWLAERGLKIRMVGRDMPGSNWHVYFTDTDGRSIELFYGMEQIGWTGRTKPTPMYERRFRAPVPLPQISEFDEVQDALAKGTDIDAGYRHVELPARFEVDGILLPRPFKIVNMGPLRLFVDDMASAEAFYRDIMGYVLTEEVTWQGQRCIFLRVNTEHHTVALYPKALRSILGLSDHTSCLSFGVQVGTYRQLCDALEFLKAEGSTIRELPSELSPGIDYSALVLDPDSHAVQLYSQMEQIGWDGKARPPEARPHVQFGHWPQQVEAQPDTYTGQVFLGPLG